MDQALQDRYAPTTRCFGCGPANPAGLRIKSFIEGDEGVCRFRAEPHHESFAGAISGGIVGTLLDCHANWTAAHHLMVANGLAQPPATVTAELTVKFLKPTPSDREIVVRARVVDASERRATVEAVVEADGIATATGRAVFVAVRDDHPAAQRW